MCGSCCIHCHSGSFFVFFPVKNYRTTPSLLSLARQVEVLPNPGSVQLPSSRILDLIKFNLHLEINLNFFIFRWLKEERVCWTTCFFWDWLRLFPTRLLILHHQLWMFPIIFSSLELSLDSYLLLMSQSGYVVIKITIFLCFSFYQFLNCSEYWKSESATLSQLCPLTK